MNKTFIPAANYNKRKWYVIDCKDKQLGRLASTIIPLLTGKSKSDYHPSMDVGDYVILINSEYLKLDRDVERFHVYQPGRPGTFIKTIRNIDAPKQLLKAVLLICYQMDFQTKHLVKRLKVYQGDATSTWSTRIQNH